MELVTIEIDLCRTEPLRIRISPVDRVTQGYVYPLEGVAVRKKNLFRPMTIYRGTLGTYTLTSGGDHVTDDEIRLGVAVLLRELRKQLQTGWDMEARIREEWLGEVTE